MSNKLDKQCPDGYKCICCDFKNSIYECEAEYAVQLDKTKHAAQKADSPAQLTTE